MADADIRKRKNAQGQGRAATPEPVAAKVDNAKTAIQSKKQQVVKQVQDAVTQQKKTELLYKVALAFVTILSFVSRCYKIDHPANVVFDEVHFGKFASYYLRREYYFDVHPPLGKLLLAGMGWFLGYDGHFLFDKIGDDYVANNVPYIGLRLLPAAAGSMIVPIVFLTLKEMGLSVAGATFGALLLILDNALIAQSRLILLDSMLTVFCIFSIYTWVKFYKQRHAPFSFGWWLWLSMTGVALALTLGVKMVGLFTVGAVGVAVLFDLWELLDYRRGLSMREFTRHFAARALCLIFLPLAIYVSFFYIHFAILTKSGSGDAFMSPAFQAELIGSALTVKAVSVPYYSNITMKHRDTGVFLHSHPDKYPLRYEDQRVSSQGQQVTGYPHKDANNEWELLPADPEHFPPASEYEPDEEETKRGYRYLRSGDHVRLRHTMTDSYLITHDVASPLTPTHMEMTTVNLEDSLKRYNETLWRVEVTDGEDGDKVKSFRNHLKIINFKHKVAVHTHKGPLPEWGFKQQEINGNKNLGEAANSWWIDEVFHENIVNGTEIGVEEEKDSKKKGEKKLSFLQKFLELQSLMISHNAGLVKPHPYSSTPITWPFVLRGISFWETKEGLRQIYLLGNPIVWWTSIVGTMMFLAMWILDRLLMRRGLDDFGPPVRRWWDRSIGFLFLTWLLHWVPFFLMGRMLFLHHYLPSFIFSAMTTAAVFEFIGRVVGESGRNVSYNTPITVWMRTQGSVGYLAALGVFIAVFVASFAYFAPLTYGLGFESVESLRTRKWLSSWDLQHA
ncbi:hypothetical protein HK104_002629 [Borealophlyctis nickersoniae]|nr:hypothetical protein HK104_002629 [Borealophlyctis nickersoniae]